MEAAPQVWHTQVAPQDGARELSKKVSVGGQLECPICYNVYDNVFKTPKLLACGHTFCLECLSRLMMILLAATDENDGSPHLLCPFCRQPTALPSGGPPALPSNHDTLYMLPSHLRQVEAVWLDKEKLCYKGSGQSSGPGTPDSPSPFCICIDVGASKDTDPPGQTQPQTIGLLDHLADWKRMVLFVVLMVLLVAVVLWPLQCVFNSGSMRCMQEPGPPDHAGTTSATSTSISSFTTGQPAVSH